VTVRSGPDFTKRPRRVAAALVGLSLLGELACSRGRPAVKHVNSPELSKPSGYTHVVEAVGGRTLYVSGQVALDGTGAVVGKGDLKAQTRQVFENLKAALKASGATLDDVVKITVFVTDMSQIQTVREVRDAYFTRNPPASTAVEVSRLVRPELMIEIDAVAVAASTD
jgi:reactive intermediate/imine deaminase